MLNLPRVQVSPSLPGFILYPILPIIKSAIAHLNRATSVTWGMMSLEEHGTGAGRASWSRSASTRQRREAAGCQPTPAQAHRGRVRLDQDHRRDGQDPASRARPGGLDVHPHRRRLQPGPTAQTARRGADLMPRSRAIHPKPRRERAATPQSTPPITRENPPNPTNRPQRAGFSGAC